jgi:hypothetical protein
MSDYRSKLISSTQAAQVVGVDRRTWLKLAGYWDLDGVATPHGVLWTLGDVVNYLAQRDAMERQRRCAILSTIGVPASALDLDTRPMRSVANPSRVDPPEDRRGGDRA